MSYEHLKLLHISCVVLSGSGFLLRGILMLFDSPWLSARVIRIFPHLIDTVLLLSAIAMIYVLPWDFMQNQWLQVKVVALLGYIVLGSFALKRGRTKLARLVYWILALLVFAYMVTVALSKSIYGAMLWF